jgi:carboxyl-terminal processing protease
MNLGFPDVCNTIVGPATVPIPYPNIALNAQAAPFSPVVKVSMMNALNMSSKIPMTSGDEAGTAHPTVKGMGAYTMGNPIVFIDKLPGINLTCPTTGNNMNNPLGAVLVPSAVNVVYTLRATVDPSALEASLKDVEPMLPGEILPGAVGVVRVARFTADLPTRIFNEMSRLEALGTRALIFDLRDNPGGELDAAVRLAGDFLPKGSLVLRTIDADGDETSLYSRSDDFYLLPLVVLVNRGTASAAEIFAGSLKAHERAVIVGETTYGKGRAQRVLPALDGPGTVLATEARFILPNGEEVEGAGIEPVLEIKGDDGEDDAPLRAAWACALEMLALG